MKKSQSNSIINIYKPTTTSTYCPLCHKENNCASATINNNNEDNQLISCWCMNTNIPQAALDLVPSEAKNKQCICLSCINKFSTK